ncbi:hypothetical protein DFJ43DRAFT_1087087 [Lentinula guzmanii]|uniref:Uncharacterized protein n=1 Tax=Lentinula guzmanii TaxID=2804957 RepID=A0AA38J828_9AGAR|nr:hypothetical protein DFJ43DRAFT_1087087 [Lentinula guzmanii]
MSFLSSSPPAFFAARNVSESPQFNRSINFENNFQSSSSSHQLQMTHNPLDQDEVNMRYIQLKMSFSALENEHKRTKFELETYKELYNQLLHTIQDAPALTSTPTTALLPIPSFQRINFLKVKLWTTQDFFDAKNGNGNRGVSLKGHFPKQTGLWFIEDEFGQPLNSHTTDYVREYAKTVWMLLRERQVKRSLPVPKNWTEANADAVNLYHHYMCHRFPFLALCDDLWKTKQIWLTDYTSWYGKRRDKINLKVEQSVKTEVKDDSLDKDSALSSLIPAKRAQTDTLTTLSLETDNSLVMAPKSPKLPRLKLSFSSAEFLTPSTAIPITPTTAKPSMPVAPATPTTAAESSPVITPPTITTDVPESTELDFAPVSATVADSIPVTAISTLQFPHTPSSPTKASPLQISTSFNATHTVDLNGLFNNPKLAASLLPPPAQVLLSPITLKAPGPLSAIIEHSSKSTSNPKPKIRFGELTVGKFVSYDALFS